MKLMGNLPISIIQGDSYSYKFTPSVTDTNPSDFYSYDITILFKDKDILSETKIPLKIIKKENPVEDIYGD